MKLEIIMNSGETHIHEIDHSNFSAAYLDLTIRNKEDIIHLSDDIIILWKNICTIKKHDVLEKVHAEEKKE